MVLAKYRVTFLILAVLMSSSLPSLLPVGLAQTEEDQRIAVDELLEILEASKSYVEAAFSRLEDLGIPIPDVAKDKYEEGLSLAATAVQLRDEARYEEAKEVALQAMQIFKEVSLEIAPDVEEAETPEEREAYEAIGLTAARERAEAFINKLDSLADKAEELGYDVSAIWEIIDEARDILSTGASLVEAGDVDEAGRHIGMAISTAAKAMGEVRPIIKANKAVQAQRFLEKAEERLARLEERIDVLSRLPAVLPPQAEQGIRQAQAALENARSRVAEVRALLQAGNIEDAIEGLEDVRRNAERSLEEFGGAKPEVAENLVAIERINATLDFLKERLEDARAKDINVDQIEETLRRAEDLLSQAVEHLQEEEIEDASQAIDQAEDLADDAEDLLEQVVELVEREEGEEAREEARELVEEIMRNRAALKQLNATISLLWEKLTDLEGRGVDVAGIENTLRTAYDFLQEALKHIDEGDVDAASDLMAQAEVIMEEAEELIEQARKQAEERQPEGAGEQSQGRGPPSEAGKPQVPFFNQIEK
ncbi:hypothetical protein [Candidatus Hecatella orcuttiae]|jgi:tetratricopeptide (TPR) repeat protein|uniref:hypothetical protein n=1 Tax=Candidatus Hecatella orcuttiae TaxID=1935119 RepID=UPI00286807B4|nr:hypothetical protein [Candidatus Hecatella orcuttiae]